MKIIPCTALEIINHPSFEALREEYIEECANAKLPKPQEKIEIYKTLDACGHLYGFAAFHDTTLLGFVFVLAPTMPHYGRLIAVVDSIFVAKKYRKSGAGLKLIRQAEQCAMSIGSPALIISVPLNGDLDKLLPRLKYTATNKAYTKELYEL